MDIQIVRELDEQLWRDFVNKHPEASIFHSVEMFNVYQRAEKHNPELWAAIQGDEVLALFLPVCINILDRPLRKISSRKVAYGSFLYAQTQKGYQGLEQLLSVYVQQPNGFALFTELRNLTDASMAKRIMEANGFLFEEHLNFLIDLTPPPDLILKGFKKRLRKQISRGLKNENLTIKEAKTMQDVSDSYAILQMTYRNARVPLPDFSLFKAAYNVLGPERLIRITLAMLGDIPVATSIDLLYKEKVYGWYGGTDRSFSKYNSTELITWDALNWGRENGYREYDFGGAGKPNEESGIRNFKGKFGGKLVNFGRFTLVHKPILFNFSVVGYNIYQNLLLRFK